MAEHEEYDRDGRYDFGRYDAGYGMDPGLRTLLGAPITAVRGGIKYPTPTKETHMPERMTKAQIENELRVNSQLLDTLHQRRADLNKMAKTAIPAEPLPETMFTVAVRFKMRGKHYQFLVLRSGEKYYTTGNKPGTEVFANWAAFVAWLEGPDVYSHSDLEILRSADMVISFTSGQRERLDKSQAPF